jgi:GTPase SAR1 family protein
MLDRYGQLKEELLGLIGSLDGAAAPERRPCPDTDSRDDNTGRSGSGYAGRLDRLRQKLEQNSFDLVVLGQFKRGKTTLINALLGEELLPTAVVPLTSIATIIEYGEETHARVVFNDGRERDITTAELADYVTEKGNPENGKDVDEVFISYPSPYLSDGVRLIDTPGVGSVYRHNTDVAYRYLPRSDAALFLLSVDQPVSQAELDFLEDVKSYSHRIFFLKNKADFVAADELEESLDFSRRVLAEHLGIPVNVYPVSARRALEGKSACSLPLLKQSGLPAFEERLNRFLMEEKGEVLLRSASGSLLRLVSRSLFEVELEEKALSAPLEELEQKLLIFERKQQEVLGEKGDFQVLFEGDLQRLIKTGLDEELGEFKRALAGELEKGIDGFLEREGGLSTRALSRELEQFIIKHIQAAYNDWWSEEDTRLAKAFEGVCDRFISRINETVDGLLRFHAELFEIDYQSIGTEELWSVQPGFYYKFRDEPVALEMIEKTFTSLLPRLVGRKVVTRRLRQYAREMIDRQGGRLRHDFAERLRGSAAAFRTEALDRIDATLSGISAAIEKGMLRRRQGGEQARVRGGDLARRKEKLTSAREEIEGLMARMEAGSGNVIT